MEKKYIKVLALFDENGTLKPTTIIWEDNRHFSIDRILCVTKEASVKYGALGTRYLCKVHGKEISLYNADNKWFIEK